MLVSTILVIYGTEFFNPPGLKIDSSQHPLHIHNNGLTQTIPTNNNFPLATGNSGHALNSEHALRDA